MKPISPENVYIIDVETWSSQAFAFGVLYHPASGRYDVYRSGPAMRDAILSKAVPGRNKEKILFLGHNIAYDMNWIFGNFEVFFRDRFEYDDMEGTKRYWCKLMVRDGRFYEVKFYNLVFWDTFNLFPLSLAKAGQVVGIPKGEGRKKFEENSNGIIDENNIQYCLTDCKITFAIFEKCRDWVTRHGSDLKRTIAANAKSILQGFNPDIKGYIKKLCCDRELSDLDESFRPAYFGGRVECHRKAGSNLKYYDVNSLYPSVMSDDSMLYPDPATLRYYPGSIESALRNFEGCAKVRVHVPDSLAIPVLPFRAMKIKGIGEGKIIYPRGTFTGTWCFPELRKAVEMGCEIVGTDWIIAGTPMRSPFYDYVKELYRERLEQQAAKDATEQITKLYLNSAYGKFGQRDYTDFILPLDEAEKLYPDTVFRTMKYKGEYYVRISTEPGRSKTDILAFASYVTSHARVRIYTYYHRCNFDILYSDTDSIITPVELPTSKQMGDMKLEHEIEFASFKGRKDYLLILKDKAILKRKGCSIKMVDYLDHEGQTIRVTKEMKEKLEKNDIPTLKLYHFADRLHIKRICKSRESLRSDLDAGHLIDSEKSRHKVEDDGRIWDGDLSVPFRLFEENGNIKIQ